ncbi:MAG TPA: ABC transporter permease [Anaerolineae bacterium]|nr:ABC transporter permease [Anaerolineae bacterium]
MTVQTHSHVPHDLCMAARQGLLPALGSGWLAGFGNMLAKELGEWFRTRRWLSQFLIWTTIINGFIAFLLFGLPALASIMPETQSAQEDLFAGFPPEIGAVMMYFSIVVMTGTMGVIVLAQDEVIQEKQSGTAAWILSKPAARLAFILTKLLSNTIGMLVFIVVLPGLVTLGEIFLATHQVVPLVPFLAGIGVILLTLFFYLSLTILGGVLFDSRGPVLGIVFGVMFGCSILKNFFLQISYVLPTSMEGVALSVVLGMPLPAMLVSQVISTAVLSILFVLVALWRFQHIEL